MIRHYYFLSIFILVLFGCSKNIKVAQKNNASEKINEYSEDLSVFRPKYSTDEPVAKPKTETSNLDLKPADSINKIKSETPAVDDILKQMKEINSKISDGKGYRIQVFSGNNKAEFENAKSYIYRNLSELEVYESYSQPTYKIKVGDFLTREDAEKYVSDLKIKFNTIRIIGDRINIKKALDIK